MAYSLGDPYRPLRLVLRINGVIVGLALGGLLAVAPHSWLQGMGWSQGGAALPWRLAGVSLLSFGIFLLLSASNRDFDRTVLVPCLLFHALLAVALLVGYLRDGFAGLDATGGTLLLTIFLLCLAGALAPVRYFGAEYHF